MSKLLTYVLNLDRHPERLATIAAQLDAQGADWVRFAAVDGAKLSEEALDCLVARSGPIPRMTRGARACTASHILIFRQFLETTADYALVLEDDAALAPTLAVDLAALVAAGGFDILNINRQTPSGQTKRLIVRRRPTLEMAGFAVHDLVGIHYGTAGYVISRHAAQVVLDLYPMPDVPIDHILFNPNLSKLFGRIRIQQLFPALVRPKEGLVSSIQNTKVEGAGSLKSRLNRAKAEVAIVPGLLLGIASGRYDLRKLGFKSGREDHQAGQE